MRELVTELAENKCVIRLYLSLVYAHPISSLLSFVCPLVPITVVIYSEHAVQSV